MVNAASGAASTRIWDFLDQPEEQSPPHAGRLPPPRSARVLDLLADELRKVLKQD